MAEHSRTGLTPIGLVVGPIALGCRGDSIHGSECADPLPQGIGNALFIRVANGALA